jgi:hypothetical protein
MKMVDVITRSFRKNVVTKLPAAPAAPEAEGKTLRIDELLGFALGAAAAALSPSATQHDVLQAFARQSTTVASTAVPAHAVVTGALVARSAVIDTFLTDAAVPAFTREVVREVIDKTLNARPDAQQPAGAIHLQSALYGAQRDKLSVEDTVGRVHAVLVNASLTHFLATDTLQNDLTPLNQQRLAALAVIDDNTWVVRQFALYGMARTVKTLMLSPEFAAMSTNDKNAALSSLWEQRSNYAGTVSDQRARTPSSTTAIATPADACTLENGAAFRLDKEAEGHVGCRATATFTDGNGSHSILLTRPDVELPRTLTTAGGIEPLPVLPSPELLAEALSLMDPEVRREVNAVVLNPVANPEDNYWRAQPGFSSTHTSAFSATHDGHIVTAYPSANHARTTPTSALDIAGDLTHEVGHFIQSTMLKDPAIEALWTAARASSDVKPSGYGFSSDGEDFAETFRLYGAVRNTPSVLAAYETLMPARFAAMRAVYAALQAKLPAPPDPTPNA